MYILVKGDGQTFNRERWKKYGAKLIGKIVNSPEDYDESLPQYLLKTKSESKISIYDSEDIDILIFTQMKVVMINNLNSVDQVKEMIV